MRPDDGGAIRSTLAWLAFPLVPALLGSTYHSTFNVFDPDPRDWGWLHWLLLAGPLAGYGFLAGATIGLPDVPGRRGVRGWLGRRSVWVAIGPWLGFVCWTSIFFVIGLLNMLVERLWPGYRDWNPPWNSLGQNTWAGWLFSWVVLIGGVGSLGYGWTLLAYVALRRARRIGRCRRAIGRGLTVAAGFVGSLFGSFWAVTEFWRGYFFDARAFPVLLAATSILLLDGCAPTLTYGDVRRRELFQALLMAWLLGLALLWRWWGRPRRGSPPS